MKRLLTALVLMPLVWAVIFLGPPWLLILVVATVAGLCFVEYADLVRAHGFPLSAWSALPSVLFLIVEALVVQRMPAVPPPFYERLLPALLLAIPGVLLAVAVLIAALRVNPLSLVLPTAGAAVLGTLYIFGPWWCAISLHAYSPHWLLFALASNWVGDSAAYFAGRKLGKNKLAPRISPGKSWEGTIAAWIATIVFAVVYLPYAVGLSYLTAAVIGAVVNPVGQLGDLVESALKRGANVKDSGNLLPGHGGWLDRLDSSLFTLPVTQFLLLTLVSTHQL